MNVVLIGMRGAGKTTVGRLLASRLGRPFIDTDDLVVAAAGMSIRDLFARHGEAAFRAHERAAVADALRNDPAVIALGGGAVMDETNRLALKSGGFVVWLKAPVESLAGRIAGDETTAAARPPLTPLDPLAELRFVLSQRATRYAELARLAVDTADVPPADVADQIVEAAGVRQM